MHASNRLSATSAATPMLRVAAAAFVSPRAAQKQSCNSQNLPKMTMAKMLRTWVVMMIVTKMVMMMVIISIMTMVVMERLRWT